MSENFPQFAKAVYNQFTNMSQHELYRVDLSGDKIWEMYLGAFPEGTNPIYRERTEHDCSCCKQFIRNLGNAVAIVGDDVITLWDNLQVPAPYNQVTDFLMKAVKSRPIVSLFRTKEGGYGAEHTLEQLEDGTVHRWHHFHGKIAYRHLSQTPDKAIGDFNTTVDLLTRGLTEFTLEALDTVVDLIQQNNLYRGEEFDFKVRHFTGLKLVYQTASPEMQKLLPWIHAVDPNARFRNTVIGTLVQDLSEGMDLEKAVKVYESKVAPHNYKRPTALITPRMVENAMATLKALNLEPAVERRFARISDVSVNNVLWVSNAAQEQMKDGIHGLLLQEAQKAPVTLNKVTEKVSIDWFMKNVAPQASKMEILVKNSQLGNFVSLTAPVHTNVNPLFKWNNNFAWSYDGNFTDSIKERVKRAGGNVDAKLRVSLGWFNYDDLDLHANCPDGHIFFGRMMGILDVDMNRTSNESREAVENLAWKNPKDGVYAIEVNQYSKRESQDVGFTIEIAYDGITEQYSYPHALRNNETVAVARLTVKHGKVESVTVSPKLIKGSASQEKWGIHTETFTEVDTLMHSPNHWNGDQTGNRHWIFALKGCKNPLPTRGIYNEFLRSDLEQHRKVFEVLGAKTQCQPTNDQLSGVGFSSTRKDVAIVKATTPDFVRTFEIHF